ncbi:ferrous iron transport protein A [Candidatus Bathyarchaeota archaeon]|nr:ferrous iron transport protein A [Candidatus Bathyarchaeota archaeon]RJS78821.1 MAG: ferrous iron transport protein A [Candidatus Bathyarchaeota archaeon]
MDSKHSASSKRQTNSRNAETSLINLREGEVGVVIRTVGGFGLVRRLAEMGLTPGTKVKVLRRAALRGPFQVEVRGVSLALGYGVASRIFVKPLRLKHE